MKLFRFDPGVGREITQYDSRKAVITRIVRVAEGASIRCVYLGPEGVVGYHPTPVNQLLLVVQGKGSVRSEEDGFIPIGTGQAVLWTAGEWHETRTEGGMTAIIIEGEELEPSGFMAEN